jgi:hypothetical protein
VRREQQSSSTTATTWESVHLLGFRFASSVVIKRHDDEQQQLVVVSFRAQYHPVQYRGAFCAFFNQVLSNIWRNAAYTLRSVFACTKFFS